LPPRASLGRVLSLAARAARAGAACLGLALLVLSGDPAAILGLLAVVALAIGGVAWTAGGRHATWVRILLLISALVVARVVAGPATAALGAVLLSLGVLLRIRTDEVMLGLAVVGSIVAAVGGASARLLLVFWLLGVALVSLGTVAAAVWRRLRRLPILKTEKTRTVLLDPVNLTFRRGTSRESTCGRQSAGQRQRT
jgi:hypothetical protein